MTSLNQSDPNLSLNGFQELQTLESETNGLKLTASDEVSVLLDDLRNLYAQSFEVSNEQMGRIVEIIINNDQEAANQVQQSLLKLGEEIKTKFQELHEEMRKGTPVHAAIIKVFGSEVLADDGEIDRRRLGGIVFSDPDALVRLESIVHPATLDAIDRRIAVTDASVVAVEAIKLVEAGMAEGCDSVWATTCRPEQQIQRIMAARGLSRAEAEQRNSDRQEDEVVVELVREDSRVTDLEQDRRERDQEDLDSEAPGGQ